MGEEIKRSQFTKEDFREFGNRLEKETEILARYFREGHFYFHRPKVGFELETWLVDKKLHPAPVNEEFLKIIKNPLVVHELSRFNLELNSSPYDAEGSVLSNLYNELEALWKECQWAAQKVDAEMMCIGILPTLKQEMLSMANISSSERYLALNEQIFLQRGGEPLRVKIQGKDEIEILHHNVMLEATATSLQIHINVPPPDAVRYYNAGLVLTGPMVALGANSPFLFGKDLWAETRIPVFEQAIELTRFYDQDDTPVGRVSLGSGYLQRSFFEPFEENLHRYPPLLPILFKEPPENLRHLRLHNGTIWRWNRPLIGLGKDHAHHLRIEHRVVGAGPSLRDVIANVGFFMGCIQELAHQAEAPEDHLDFSHVRSNLYLAAQKGLEARIRWLDGKEVSVKQLLLEVLVPMAKKGLQALHVSDEDIKNYIEGIIFPRVQSGQNGAAWLRKAKDKFGGNFAEVTAAYLEHQRIGDPVHLWSL